MEHWFKYEFGYVNIDDDYLYLTNSGNWRETQKLKEKTKQIAEIKNQYGIAVVMFTVLIIGVIMVLMSMNILTKMYTTMLVLVTFGIGYRVYLKTELGVLPFKIPHEKIKNIDFKKNNITIMFVNGEGDEDWQHLVGVEAKGLEIMGDLDNMWDDD